MIAAQIDVKLKDHPRAVRAGGAAMGLWTWGMLHDKDHMSDGLLDRAVVLRCPWFASEAEVEAHAVTLVTVGLWSVTDTGYRVHRHAEKNETRTQIESRIAAKRGVTRDRVRAFRSKKKAESDINLSVDGNAVTAALPEMRRDRDEMSTDVCISGSDAREVTPTLTPPPKDIPVTEAIRTNCVVAGAPVPTPADVQDCLANARAKGWTRADWGAELVRWMQRARDFRARGNPGKVLQQPPASGPIWKTGES